MCCKYGLLGFTVTLQTTDKFARNFGSALTEINYRRTNRNSRDSYIGELFNLIDHFLACTNKVCRSDSFGSDEAFFRWRDVEARSATILGATPPLVLSRGWLHSLQREAG
jgi:hypothetical protein